MKLFLTDSIPSCNFAYSATVKPRPSADYIGMEISILPPIQLVFNVIELAVLQRILYNTILQNNFFNTMLPICRKTLYHSPFLNLHRLRALGSTIHQGLISKSMQHRKVEKFRKRE